jgi:hypothetical protein
MVLVCPGCQSKVVTATGYPLAMVACGNCGTDIQVPKDGESAADPAPTVKVLPEPKRGWWHRLFG